jgi:hypothetical protein
MSLSRSGKTRRQRAASVAFPPETLTNARSRQRVIIVRSAVDRVSPAARRYSGEDRTWRVLMTRLTPFTPVAIDSAKAFCSAEATVPLRYTV